MVFLSAAFRRELRLGARTVPSRRLVFQREEWGEDLYSAGGRARSRHNGVGVPGCAFYARRPMLSAARAVGSLLLLPTLALVACSSDAATVAVAPTTLSSEAETFIGELCAIEQPCCTAASTCTATAGAFGLGKDFDGAKAAACLTELRAAADQPSAAAGRSGYCDRAPDVFACEAVFKTFQAVATGKACASSADCANPGDAFGLCVGSGSNARCHAVTRGKAGDACVGTRANGTTADLTGAAASATALCFLADDLQCDAKSKVCARRAILGSDCDPANEAACVDTTYCPIDSKQCTARAAPGETCTDSDACQTGYLCAATGEGNATVCVAYAKEGEACPRGDECDFSLACDSGTATCTKDTTAAVRACNGQSALGL